MTSVDQNQIAGCACQQPNRSRQNTKKRNTLPCAGNTPQDHRNLLNWGTQGVYCPPFPKFCNKNPVNKISASASRFPTFKRRHFQQRQRAESCPCLQPMRANGSISPALLLPMSVQAALTGKRLRRGPDRCCPHLQFAFDPAPESAQWPTNRHRHG